MNAFLNPSRKITLLFYLFSALSLPRFPSLHAETPLTESRKITHVLNRIGFGPRPGDLESIQKLGLQQYVDAQLHPEKLDLSALQAKLEKFKTLSMTSKELTTDFYREIQRFVKNQQAAGNQLNPKAPPPAPQGMEGSTPSMKPNPAPAPANYMELLNAAQDRLSLIALGELQTAKVLRAVESPAQLQEVLIDFWSNHFNIDVNKGPCRVLKVIDEREVIRPHVLGKFKDLLTASAKSPAMLFYLDNTLNSIPRKVSPMEQKIRAKVYESKTGISPPEEMMASGKEVTDGGLNENYGREIMELHTLGVDGGYTQEDVYEVARCFSGWGMHPFEGTFFFNPKRHDSGEKTVLGHKFPANGGIADGEKVLAILAAHPSTAKHISFKLCQKFISDAPPASIVDKTAAVFLKSGGDLQEVMQTILNSAEFYSPSAYRSKVKSPFEFAVSSVRALGGKLNDGNVGPKALALRHMIEGSATIGFGMDFVSKMPRKSLNWHIYEMGQPLYAFQAPTGYPGDSRKWVSTGALISRLNFSLALTAQSVSDVSIPLKDLLAGVDIDRPDLVLETLIQKMIQGETTEATLKVLQKQIHGDGTKANTVDVPQITALILGSPEFQHH